LEYPMDLVQNLIFSGLIPYLLQIHPWNFLNIWRKGLKFDFI
jgi:hypothetical protein